MCANGGLCRISIIFKNPPPGMFNDKRINNLLRTHILNLFFFYYMDRNSALYTSSLNEKCRMCQYANTMFPIGEYKTMQLVVAPRNDWSQILFVLKCLWSCFYQFGISQLPHKVSFWHWFAMMLCQWLDQSHAQHFRKVWRHMLMDWAAMRIRIREYTDADFKQV